MMKTNVLAMLLLLWCSQAAVMAENEPTADDAVAMASEPVETPREPIEIAFQPALQVTTAVGNVAAAAVTAVADMCDDSLTFFERDVLTHRRFISREYLDPSGFTVGFNLGSVYQVNARNGLDTSAKKQRLTGNYSVEMAGDLEKLLNIPGAGFYVSAGGSWRDGISDFMVGTGVNGEAGGNREIDVTAVWYEHAFFDCKLRLRVGKMGLGGGFECGGSTVAFDGSDYASSSSSQFLNDHLGGNSTVPLPDDGLGIALHYCSGDTWYLSVGAADAQADGRETGFSTTFHDEDYFVYVMETGLTPDFASAQGPLHGAYRFGFWYDPQDKDRASGSVKRDDCGFYVNCDQILLKENDDEDDSQGLAAFAKYGYAHSDVSEITNFWSTGVQYQGLLPNRDDDVIAFGVAQALFSDQFDQDFTEDSETVMEFYYNALVAAKETLEFTLTPSVQHIINPAGDRDIKDATVVALRGQLSF